MWAYREREVWCIQTCSVPLACPQAAMSECTALSEMPILMEDCGYLSTCTSTTLARSTSGLSTSTTTITTVTAATTTVVSGSGGGDSSSGNDADNSNPDDWECNVVLGQKASASNCLTGANAADLCGAGCPCCRRKLDSAAGGIASTVISSTSADSGGDMIPIIIAAASGAGLLLAMGYGFWYLRQRRQRLRVAVQKSLSSVQQNPSASRTFKDDLQYTEARSDATRGSRHAQSAWSEHFNSFDVPPEVDANLDDVLRKTGKGSSQKATRFSEEDSTDDSEHGGEDPFGSRRSGTSDGGEDPFGSRRNGDKDASRAEHMAHQASSRSRGNSRKRFDAQASTRTTEEADVRKSATTTSDGTYASRDKPRSASQAAAEDAFEEGLGAGKAKEERSVRREASEKRKARPSPGSTSAHPKGTAVPPRPRDAADSIPSTSAGAAGASAHHQAPHSSSASDSKKPSDSGTGGQGAQTNANSTEAKADIGAATLVNEHVVKLDAELDSTRTKDVEWRKKNFKNLLLKWHPDKNTGGMGEAESAAQANEVFKHLLARRDRYLAE